jgi:hypothetical protein
MRAKFDFETVYKKLLIYTTIKSEIRRIRKGDLVLITTLTNVARYNRNKIT